MIVVTDDKGDFTIKFPCLIRSSCNGAASLVTKMAIFRGTVLSKMFRLALSAAQYFQFFDTSGF